MISKTQRKIYYLIVIELAVILTIISFRLAYSSRLYVAVGGEIFVFPLILFAAYKLEKNWEVLKRGYIRIVRFLKIG